MKLIIHNNTTLTDVEALQILLKQLGGYKGESKKGFAIKRYRTGNKPDTFTWDIYDER